MTKREERGCDPDFRRIGCFALHLKGKPYYWNASRSNMNKKCVPKKKVVKPKQRIR